VLNSHACFGSYANIDCLRYYGATAKRHRLIRYYNMPSFPHGTIPVKYTLVAKRSEIGGIIADLEERTRQARADLAHIDATPPMFYPDAKPQSIKGKPQSIKGKCCGGRRSGLFANGEISKRIREALRAETEPLSAEALVRQAMTDKGLDPDDKPSRQAMMKAFLWALHRMQVVGSVRRFGKGLGARWTAAGK
jgi:hypothetical protein